MEVLWIYENRPVIFIENHTSINESSCKNVLSLPREIMESLEISAYSVSMILFSTIRSSTAEEDSSLLLISHLS